MNGIETFRTIRKLMPRLGIVMLTVRTQKRTSSRRWMLEQATT